MLPGGGERERDGDTDTDRHRERDTETETQRERETECVCVCERERERVPVVEIRTIWFLKDFFSHIKGPYCFVSQLFIVSVPCGLPTVFITAQRVHPSRRKVWTPFR